MTAFQPRHVTLDDIAAAAGVSTTTVSRVLRDSPAVREPTRLRVLEKVRELGYEPDHVARSLSTRSSTLVGIVVHEVAAPFYARVLKGARDALHDAGYQVLLMESVRDEATERAAIRTLVAHRVAGILLTTSGGEAPASVPIVYFDEIGSVRDASRVVEDDRAGADLLVEHLLGHGHRRIAFIGGAPGLYTSTERAEGFRDALARRWLAVPPGYVRHGDKWWTPEDAGRQAAELLALDPPPTAIVTADDRQAIGVLRSLRALGLRVPEDVALVCYDDPPYGDVIDPPITCVAHDGVGVGAHAARLLLEQLAEPEREPREVRMPVELIVRRSCGCP